jgi:hypothetical protein
MKYVIMLFVGFLLAFGFAVTPVGGFEHVMLSVLTFLSIVGFMLFPLMNDAFKSVGDLS